MVKYDIIILTIVEKKESYNVSIENGTIYMKNFFLDDSFIMQDISVNNIGNRSFLLSL